MANLMVPQGVLNRALTSVAVIDSPELNVTSGFFGTKVARLTFEGEASDYLGTLTGAVASPRLYQIVTVMMYLNKSQPLAAQYEQVRLTDTNLGDVIFVTDSPTLPWYYLYNCTFMNVADIDGAGESNDFPVLIKGYYPVNSSAFG